MHPPRVMAVTLLASILTGSLAIIFNYTAVPQPTTSDASSRLHMKADATTNKDDEEKLISFFEAKRFVKSMMGLPKDIKTNYLKKNAEPRVVFEHLVKVTVNDVDNILASSRVQIVEMYILEYNKLNPNGRKYLIDVFRDVYGDDGAVTVILNARDDRDTKELAIRLQIVLFQRWLNDKEMIVPNLLEVLGLDNSATFDCKRLKMLLEYVNVLARRHRNKTLTPEDLLTKVTANEQELIGIIAKLPQSKEAERVLFHSWEDNDFPREKVIKEFASQLITNEEVHNLLQRYRLFEPGIE